MKIKKISLGEQVFKKNFIFSGHYDFKIKVEYENGSTNEIDRRYSEIDELYQHLLLFCPGCQIKHIPPKSIWLKLKYGNEEQLKERVEGIRNFFTHIAEHEILSKNKYVNHFLSDNYKRKESKSSSSSNNLSKKKEDSDDDDDVGFDNDFSNITENIGKKKKQ